MYNKNFKLDRRQLELIEMSLNYQLGRLSERRRTHVESTIVPESELEAVKEIDAEIREITELLGALHNQKKWYRPKGTYISG